MQLFLTFFSGKRTHVALVCCHLLTKMFYVFLLPEIHLHTISYLTLVSAYCMKAWEYLLPIAPLTVPFLRSFYPGVQRFHQILTHQCMQVWNKECNGGNMLDMLHFLKAYLPAAINILNPCTKKENGLLAHESQLLFWCMWRIDWKEECYLTSNWRTLFFQTVN